jgi:hypothetical protein
MREAAGKLYKAYMEVGCDEEVCACGVRTVPRFFAAFSRLPGLSSALAHISFHIPPFLTPQRNAGEHLRGDAQALQRPHGPVDHRQARAHPRVGPARFRGGPSPFYCLTPPDTSRIIGPCRSRAVSPSPHPLLGCMLPAVPALLPTLPPWRPCPYPWCCRISRSVWRSSRRRSKR